MSDNNFNIYISKENKSIISIEDFSLIEGKINFLLGESGIGKTMISKAIFGILDSDRFQIDINHIKYKEYINQHSTIKIKENGFFVFQEPSTHLNPLLKIGTQLKEGNLGIGKNEHDILKELWKNSDKKHYLSLLKVYPKPHRPSGGEKQRFLLVMALKKIDRYLESNNQSKPLFIFDEPTGSLDDQLRNWFLELLFKKYKTKPFTILFITHDYSIISEVVTNHDLNKSIIFTELQRKQNQLIQQIFDEKQYLNWIYKSKQKTSSLKQKSSKCIFELGTPVKVFKKEIGIFTANGKSTPLKIHEGEIVYLKAPSGMGKTTVAKIIMGLIEAKQFNFKIGTDQFNSKTSQNMWKKRIWGKLISMTFQHADEALNLNSTVLQTLMNIPKNKRLEINALLKHLNYLFDSKIENTFLKKRIHQLSGGQKQRINLLRAFLLDTPLLILDEPLNGLDFNSIQKVINMINEKREKGTGILLISHNEEIMETIISPESIYFLK